MRSWRDETLMRALGSSVMYSSMRALNAGETLMRLAPCAGGGAERRALCKVAIDDHLLLPRERLAHALRIHVRIAVHVAAHPRAEANDRGQLERFGRNAVEFLERLADLIVERRHHAVEDLDEVEEHVLALICDGECLAGGVLR